MAVVVHLDLGVDSCFDRKLGRVTALIRGLDRDLGMRFESLCYSGELERLRAVQPERLGVLLGQELERQDPHADEVAPVDAFEAFCDDRTHAL